MGKLARANAKKKQQLLNLPTIELRNPHKEQFPLFIAGNHTKWFEVAMAELTKNHPEKAAEIARLSEEAGPTGSEWSDIWPQWIKFLEVARKALEETGSDKFVAEENSGKGKELVICGAGPSLKEHAAEYCTPERDVWGCNSALTWLGDNGFPVTHGFSVDQTLEMLVEWNTTPDVEYLVASTVHPHLLELLIMRGRKIRFFHNYVGVPGVVSYDGETLSREDWMYSLLYPTTVRTGSGLNSVNRAIDLGLYMGYEKIYVLGADCSIQFNSMPPEGVGQDSPEYLEWLGKETTMHANGDSSVHGGLSPITFFGEIDGTHWLTKPDMSTSAVWLVKVEQMQNGRVELVGNTLPVALRGKSDDYLKRLPGLANTKGEIMFPAFAGAA